MEHLKRAVLQTYIWKQCIDQNITMPAIDGRGWKEEEGQITPVWFLTSQLPPSLSQRNANKRNDGYNADSEDNEVQEKVS